MGSSTTMHYLRESYRNASNAETHTYLLLVLAIHSDDPALYLHRFVQMVPGSDTPWMDTINLISHPFQLPSVVRKTICLHTFMTFMWVLAYLTWYLDYCPLLRLTT